MTTTARPARPVPAHRGAALRERGVKAGRAMGTMVPASGAALSDFGGYLGSNEILNVIRPGHAELPGQFQFVPEQSTVALITSPPGATYFPA
jgi:hypothetical protein